jgi:hypothetical protein
MKKKFAIIVVFLVTLAVFVGCSPHHHIHVHKKQVRVHKTSEGRYVYQDPNTFLWYYLILANNSGSTTYNYYSGGLSSYRSSGARWQQVEEKEVPEEIQELVENEAQNPTEIAGENLEVAETIEVDVLDNNQPIDPSSDLGGDGLSDYTEQMDSSVDTSDSSSSFDSSGSFDSSSSSPE